jgi:uncharacterized protein
MADYLYLIHPFRQAFFEDPTPEEGAILEQHFNYLKEAKEAGTVILAGPCTDHTFGLVVFRAENDEAANAFMHADPSVKKNVMVAEMHPLHISIMSK